MGYGVVGTVVGYWWVGGERVEVERERERGWGGVGWEMGSEGEDERC